MSNILAFLAFEVFNTIVLGLFCLSLALLYIWKRLHPEKVISRGKQGYTVKAFNWLIFALAFFHFHYLPLEVGRSLLRMSAAFLIISELAFQWYYIRLILEDLKKKWTLTS